MQEWDDLSQATEEDEEGRKPKGMIAPQVASKEEREEHERNHIPYRSWCQACAKGRNRKKPHVKKTREKGKAGRSSKWSVEDKHGLPLHE